MKKFTVTLLAIALVALGAMFVFAQTEGQNMDEKKVERQGRHGKFGKRGKRGHRGKRGNQMGRLFRQLDLTDAQKAQMKQIRQANRETSKSLRQQMGQLRQQAAELGTDGIYDDTQVQALASQQADLMKQMFVQKQKEKAQMFAVLTPEQKAKSAQMKAEFKQKMQERKAKRAAKKAEKANQ